MKTIKIIIFFLILISLMISINNPVFSLSSSFTQPLNEIIVQNEKKSDESLFKPELFIYRLELLVGVLSIIVVILLGYAAMATYFTRKEAKENYKESKNELEEIKKDHNKLKEYTDSEIEKIIGKLKLEIVPNLRTPEEIEKVLKENLKNEYFNHITSTLINLRESQNNAINGQKDFAHIITEKINKLEKKLENLENVCISSNNNKK